jgi:hypothetical protein
MRPGNFSANVLMHEMNEWEDELKGCRLQATSFKFKQRKERSSLRSLYS